MDPQRITVEASDLAICELDLDTCEGEQYDYIDDVIAVELEAQDIVITTCRTIKRPDRPVYRIPSKYLKKIHWGING